MQPDPFADATQPGATDWVALDTDKMVLFYPDGTVRFRHTCDRTPQGRGVIICAPLLRIGNGHTVTHRTPLTISPSIHCGDCGQHGGIWDGTWVPC